MNLLMGFLQKLVITNNIIYPFLLTQHQTKPQFKFKSMKDLTPKQFPNHRPIRFIADDIGMDWGTMSPYAKPYWEAMQQLNWITDSYYFDSAESVLRYFLSNAQGWKGETAKRIKSEIKDILKLCK